MLSTRMAAIIRSGWRSAPACDLPVQAAAPCPANGARHITGSSRPGSPRRSAPPSRSARRGTSFDPRRLGGRVYVTKVLRQLAPVGIGPHFRSSVSARKPLIPHHIASRWRALSDDTCSRKLLIRRQIELELTAIVLPWCDAKASVGMKRLLPAFAEISSGINTCERRCRMIRDPRSILCRFRSVTCE